jgi:hypothetical protein
MLSPVPVPTALKKIDQALQLGLCDFLRLSQLFVSVSQLPDAVALPHNHLHSGGAEFLGGGDLPIGLGVMLTHGGHLHFGFGLLLENELHGLFDVHGHVRAV